MRAWPLVLLLAALASLAWLAHDRCLEAFGPITHQRLRISQGTLAPVPPPAPLAVPVAPAAPLPPRPRAAPRFIPVRNLPPRDSGMLFLVAELAELRRQWTFLLRSEGTRVFPALLGNIDDRRLSGFTERELATLEKLPEGDLPAELIEDVRSLTRFAIAAGRSLPAWRERGICRKIQAVLPIVGPSLREARDAIGDRAVVVEGERELFNEGAPIEHALLRYDSELRLIGWTPWARLDSDESAELDSGGAALTLLLWRRPQLDREPVIVRLRLR